MNQIKCSCEEEIFFDENTLERKKIFKEKHRPHLQGKFRIYPDGLLQIVCNMNDGFKNEDGEDFDENN